MLGSYVVHVSLHLTPIKGLVSLLFLCHNMYNKSLKASLSSVAGRHLQDRSKPSVHFLLQDS